MKYLLLGALVVSGACQAGSLTKISESALRLPEMMSTVKLLHNQDRFLVSDDEGLHEIDNCWLDSDLRTLARNPILLDKFQQFGYISVNKDTEGNYILRKHVRGKGGGPLLGAAVYVGVKSFLYAAIGSAVAATAVGTATVTGGVGPAAIPAMISAATAGAPAIAVGAAGAGAAAGAAVGTTAVAGQAVLMTTAGAAMTGTAAGMGGTGAFASIFALEAMITAVATAAGLACGMTPTV